MKRSALNRKTPLRRTAQRTRGNAKTRAGQVRLDAAKAEVRGRSGGWCEAGTPACPEGRHLAHHAHHILMRSQGGKHEADNLLHVCGRGHDWIHKHHEQSYERGWLRHREAS